MIDKDDPSSHHRGKPHQVSLTGGLELHYNLLSALRYALYTLYLALNKEGTNKREGDHELEKKEKPLILRVISTLGQVIVVA